MSGARVVELSSDRIEPCQEHAGQRRQRRYLAEVAVHAGDDRLRLSARGCVHFDQRHQMRGPHPGCQAFAADVTQGKDYAGAYLLCSEKVARQVTNGKNLAGNLEIAMPDQAWGAETPVYQCSFEECGVQIGVIFLKFRDLPLQLPPA